jgi:hypothetical protein
VFPKWVKLLRGRGLAWRAKVRAETPQANSGGGVGLVL